LIVDKYGRRQANGPQMISLQEVSLMPFGLAIEDSLEIAHISGKGCVLLWHSGTDLGNLQAVDHPNKPLQLSARDFSDI
jgi:hypothetical protein